ncbi:MAG: nitroreductase family protein [bacterium]
MMAENVIDFILKRQSCRDFKSDPLRAGDLERLMEAMRWAPSAGNCQPWFFYVVTNREAKEGLSRAAYGQSFIADAPVVFVICAHAQESGWAYGERWRTSSESSIEPLRDRNSRRSQIHIWSVAHSLTGVKRKVINALNNHGRLK